MRSVEGGSAVRVGTRVTRLGATAIGRLLALPVGWVARWRHGKPMHPRGEVHVAVLERTGTCCCRPRVVGRARGGCRRCGATPPRATAR